MSQLKTKQKHSSIVDSKSQKMQRSRTQLLATTIAVFGVSMGVNISDVIAGSLKTTTEIATQKAISTAGNIDSSWLENNKKRLPTINSQTDINSWKMNKAEQMNRPDIKSIKIEVD